MHRNIYDERQNPKMVDESEQRFEDISKYFLKYVFCTLHDFLSWSSLQGSKSQLEEVWEEEDGFDKDQFNPRTFFKLHGK